MAAIGPVPPQCAPRQAPDRQCIPQRKPPCRASLKPPVHWALVQQGPCQGLPLINCLSVRLNNKAADQATLAECLHKP